MLWGFINFYGVLSVQKDPCGIIYEAQIFYDIECPSQCEWHAKRSEKALKKIMIGRRGHGMHRKKC